MSRCYPPVHRPISGLSLLLGALALVLPATANAADARPDVPDEAYSLIYVAERADEVVPPAPRPVREYSSEVQVRALPPQDSPDVAVLPSSVVTQSEVSTFVDPSDPDLVLVSANATDWPVTTVFGTGVYWSTDGGSTWAGDDTGPGGVGNSGDPAIVVRAVDDSWVVGYISSGFGQGVSYTTDQGSNWSHVN
ncbi:MAG TPA: hypothetical protein VKU85_19320, partial [bacterium]|nr:hypothetical protein [bacterium]